MTAEEIKKEVDSIIERTFVMLQIIYHYSKFNSHKYEFGLIFPKYRNGELRISEQELRFAFAKAFRYSAYAKEKKWRCSIETPTREIYSFSDGVPRVVTRNNGGEYINPTDRKRGFRSGNFDLVIHDAKNDPICLIEFKGDCRSPKAYYKDFEKLIHDMEDEPNVARYFIQLLETKESVEKIAEKLKNDTNPNKKIYKKHLRGASPKIEYRGYVLEDETTLNEFPAL